MGIKSMRGAMDLSGKIALVTGASSGLGRHFVKVLARAGATVGATARRLDRLEGLVEECRSEGLRVLAAPADVADRASVFAAVQRIEEEAGVVTVLVNAAGVSINKSFLDHEPQDFDQVVGTNLKGTWNTTQAVARRLVAAKQPGAIVNVGSIFGHRVAGNASSYCASKAAVLHLTRALSLELTRHGIRVNALSPGLFQTEMTEHMFDGGYADALIKHTPARRAGVPTDLDGALLLLASDASRFMSGSVLVVDGGILNSSL
ncbi:MAG: SDR family oxidoreductase [Burkholderiaceae bacterium]|nr:SDR family oxidoreductase [Burkholderiaceae bacterium]